MKLMLLLLAGLCWGAPADPNYLDPADVLKSDGVLAISDGSTVYGFKADGTFEAGPVGVSGRGFLGTWTADRSNPMKFTARARLTWVNGEQSRDEYRKIVFIVYHGSTRPPDPRRLGEGSYKRIFDGYFIIDELVKIPSPGRRPQKTK